MFLCFFILGFVQLCIKDIEFTEQQCPDGYEEYHQISDIYEHMEYYSTKIIILSKNISSENNNYIDLSILNFAFIEIFGDNQIIPFKFKSGQVKSSKFMYLSNMIVEAIEDTPSVRFDSLILNNVSFITHKLLSFAAYRIESTISALSPFKSISATEYYLDIDDITDFKDYLSVFVTNSNTASQYSHIMNFFNSNVSFSLLSSMFQITINETCGFKIFSEKTIQTFNFNNSVVCVSQDSKGESEKTLNLILRSSNVTFYSNSIEISHYNFEVRTYDTFIGLYGNYFNMYLHINGNSALETSSQKLTIFSFHDDNANLTFNPLSKYLMLYVDDLTFSKAVGFNMHDTTSIFITALKLTIAECPYWQIPPNIQMYAKVSLILDSSNGTIEQIEMNTDTEVIIKMKNVDNYKMDVDSNKFQKFSQLVNFEYTGSFTDDVVQPYLFKRQDILCGIDLPCDDWFSSFKTSNNLIGNYTNVKEYCTPYLNDQQERCFSIEFIGLPSDVDAEFCYADEYDSCIGYAHYINKDNFTTIKDYITDITISVRLIFASSLPSEYELDFDEFPLNKKVDIRSLSKQKIKSITIRITNETKYHVNNLQLSYITVRFQTKDSPTLGIPYLNISQNVILDNNFEYIKLTDTFVVTVPSHLPDVANSDAESVTVICEKVSGIRCDGSNQFVLNFENNNDISFIWDTKSLIYFDFPSSVTNFEFSKKNKNSDILAYFDFVFRADSVKLIIQNEFSKFSTIGIVQSSNIIIESKSSVIPFTITSQSIVFDSSNDIYLYGSEIMNIFNFDIELSSTQQQVTYYKPDLITFSNISTTNISNFILDSFLISELAEFKLNSFILKGNSLMDIHTKLTITESDIKALNLTIKTDICNMPSLLIIPNLYRYQIPIPEGLFIDPICSNSSYLINQTKLDSKVITLPSEDAANLIINLVGLTQTYLQINSTIYNFSLYANANEIYLSAQKESHNNEKDDETTSNALFILMIISICLCMLTSIITIVFIIVKIKKSRKKDTPQEYLSYYGNDILQFLS